MHRDDCPSRWDVTRDAERDFYDYGSHHRRYYDGCEEAERYHQTEMRRLEEEAADRRAQERRDEERRMEEEAIRQAEEEEYQRAQEEQYYRDQEAEYYRQGDGAEDDDFKCSTCKGKGTVNPLTAPPDFFCVGTTDCPHCDGTGVI